MLAGAVAVTLLALAAARTLRVDSNLIALLPPETPSVRRLHQALAKTGGSGDLIVLIEAPSRGGALRTAEELLPDIRALPWVGEASTGRDTTFFKQHELLYLSLEDLRRIEERVDERLRYESKRANPLYVSVDDPEPPPSLDFSDLDARARATGGPRYFQSTDGKMLAIVVKPKGVTGDLSFARRIRAELEAVVSRHDAARRDPSIKTSVGGTFVNRVDEYDTIIGDVWSSAGWVALPIALLIALYFRRVSAIPILGVPLAMGIVWTFGLAALLVGTLNLITVFLITILMGLGIDFSIHMLARYRNERAAGRLPDEALALTIEHAGRSSLTSALANAAAFFALVPTTLKGFSEFGLIAGLGLLMSAVASLLVLPSVLVVAERLGGFGGFGASRARRLRGSALPRPGLILAAASALSLAALIALPRVQLGHDLRRLRADVPATRAFKTKLAQVFKGERDGAVVLVEGPAQAAAVARELRARQAAHGERSTIERVWSMTDLVPEEQPAKLALLARLRDRVQARRELLPPEAEAQLARLDTTLAAGPVRLQDLPPHLARQFLGKPGTPGQLVFVVNRRSLLDLRNASAFAAEVSDLRVGGATYQPAGESLVYADMVRVLRRDAPLAIGLISLALIAFSLLDFRSLRRTALVLSPLGVGMLWLVGAMGALRIELTILNAVALPTVLGLGIDGGVHLYHRYLELGRGRMTQVLRETGGNLAVSFGVSIIGFAGLLTATHAGLRSIGTLAVTGLAAVVLAALVFLPAALAVERRTAARSPATTAVAPLEEAV